VPSRIRTILEFVKIEHALFALPFVLAGMIVGQREARLSFSAWTLLLVLVAAVGARTLAMTLNRIIDERIDAANPRTANRALPAGLLSKRAAWIIAGVSLAALVVVAMMLNALVTMLSPVLVLLFVAYPYAKRYTWACHFVLGLAFFCAPVGGYLAVRGQLDGVLPVGALGVAAFAWVAGFDIIYALLDVEHDRAHSIHSIPADFGEANARRIAAGLHVVTVLALAAFAYLAGLGWPMYVALVAVGALLAYEHATVDPRDPVAINKAFFNVNAVVGWIALAGLVGATVI
jgi:4-hydroxybenzoate polyprenyltransferase